MEIFTSLDDSKRWHGILLRDGYISQDADSRDVIIAIILGFTFQDIPVALKLLMFDGESTASVYKDAIIQVFMLILYLEASLRHGYLRHSQVN